MHFCMISDPENFEATVNIESTYDALAHANGLDIKSPEMLLAGNIENRGGLVRVINKYGSIYQNATINAAELKLTSGGNLFIQGKGDGIHNLGPHPDAAFSNYVDPRENAPGANAGFSGESSLGGCRTSNPANGSNQNLYDCEIASVNQSNTPQFSGNDAVIAGGKIFVANTVNLNGLIQSGIAEKS